MESLSLSGNQRFDLHDQLNTSLAKALALSTLALDENFRDYTDSVRHGCLWAINDYIEASINAADKLQGLHKNI